MSGRWLLDRDDPRTGFVVCAAILVFGALVTPKFIRSGGTFGAVWMIVWLAATVGQLIYTIVRLRRFYRQRDSRNIDEQDHG